MKKATIVMGVVLVLVVAVSGVLIVRRINKESWIEGCRSANWFSDETCTPLSEFSECDFRNRCWIKEDTD